MKALILADNGFEDLTLFLPWYRLREEGVDVTVACPFLHAVTVVHGYAVEPDTAIHEVNPAEYELLLIPDGPAAEHLRQREEAVDVARTFVEDGRKVAAIGHGAQLLISAGVLDGHCDRPGRKRARGRQQDGEYSANANPITPSSHRCLPNWRAPAIPSASR